MPEFALNACARCDLAVPADAPAGACPACLLSIALRSRSPVIGRYRLLGLLGRGSMGRVYEAEDVSSGQRVALKLLGRRWSTPGLEGGRMREGPLLGALDHPNIVPLYSGGEYRGRAYCTMRLLCGGTLAQRRGEFRNQPRAVAQLVAQIARAVHHAHESKIVHCDLKLDNVLLDRVGRPYVADFGIARRVGGASGERALCGTPGYIAPELVADPACEPTAVSDVFSLGVMLYELLCGQRPFRGDSFEDYRHSLGAIRDPERLWRLAPAVDGTLENIVFKAIQRSPRQRYGSAEALADDLERWLTGKRPIIDPRPLWQRWLEEAARRLEPRLVLLAAALLLYALGGRLPVALADSFSAAMVTPLLAPICAAMGFATLVTVSGCHLHLVQLLLLPLRRVRWLLLPGGILVAYFINLAIPSQTSTAAALGSILVPLLVHSGYAPTIAGAAVLLGASYGGDLLNPGAADIQAVVGLVPELSASALSRQLIPASIAGALTAAAVFALLHRPAEAERSGGSRSAPSESSLRAAQALPSLARIDPLRAALPLVPVALLLAAYAGTDSLAWLLAAVPGPLQNTLPVVRAMLIGTVLAVAVGWRDLPGQAQAFFGGMGSAYANIVTLTIAAKCFGDGLAASGLSDHLVEFARSRGSLEALAAAFPGVFAIVSGSGTGPVLVFAEVVLGKLSLGEDAVRYAALSCLSGEFGRTLSPVAAVVAYTSLLVGVSPLALIRALLPALAAGAAVSFAIAAR